MKTHAAISLLFLIAALAGCRESSSARANRLAAEARQIQNTTLRAILANDLKFEIDLDDQEQFFKDLRDDLDRCRSIEAELRVINEVSTLSQLEESTTDIFTAIAKREEQIRSYRQATSHGSKSVDSLKTIEDLERTIEIFRETGRNTEPVERLINQLKKQQAEQGAASDR